MKHNEPQSPIMQKAMELVQLTIALDKLIPEENEYLQATRGFMLENAYIIPAKIAGAEGIGLYDLQMENAAIIRKAARELSVQAGSLRFEKSINANDYILLVRNTVDDFRLLFIEWVKTFDIDNYIPDSWGLFNPPGVSPEDYFKDDNGLPYDSKEKLEDYDRNYNDFLNFDDDEDDDDKN
ncbi:hypothetical protein [Flavobacterium sp.]|uniref:hypothetical protein n=1 Tax=Flavobacterium sp. TaxID=239 RepID=UPI00375206BA